MPAPRQRSNALSALAQLACLGVPGDAVVDDLLLVLRDLVGWDLSVYMALDAQAGPADLRTSPGVTQQEMATYLRRWHGRGESAHFAPQMRDALRRRLYDCVRTSDAMPRLHHTAYFNEMMRPAGLAWGVRAVLREDGVPLGTFALGRARGRPDFSQRDVALLRQALPHIAHAVARKGAARAQDGGDPLHAAESALVLVDGQGRIQSGSGAAWSLLARAAGRAQALGTVDDLALAWAQPWLAALVQRMQALLLGAPGRPPVVVERNRYGSFHLRGYVLEPGGGAMAGLYGVQIERRVPLAQRLFVSAAFREFTARERDVCLHLAQGGATADIAQALGVQASTVVTHTRSIYQRLQINARSQLVPALLS